MIIDGMTGLMAVFQVGPSIRSLARVTKRRVVVIHEISPVASAPFLQRNSHVVDNCWESMTFWIEWDLREHHAEFCGFAIEIV